MSQPLKFNLWDFLDQDITKEPPIPDIRIANLYPSEASVEYRDSNNNRVVHGTCMRKAWFRVKVMETFASTRQKQYNLAGAGEKMIPVQPSGYSPKTMWIFRAGDKFEQLVMEQMKNAGVLVGGHRRFVKKTRHGYYISGELDALGRDPFTGEIFGVEVKSTHGYMAEKEIVGDLGTRNAGRKGKPKIEHVMQALLYCDAWPELPYFKVVYVLRDKMLRTEFDVSLDHASGKIYIDGVPLDAFRFHDIMDRYNSLAWHLNNNKLPGRDYDMVWDDNKVNIAAKQGRLSKTNKTAWEKYWNREQEIKEKGKGRHLKRPVLGDWQCSYCDYKNVCYNADGTNKDFELTGE